MEKPIELRVVKVTVASWICTGITLIIQLVSIPVCLHFWGKNTYGVWLAVFAAFTLLRTIDYGYTLYVGNKLNILYHTDDRALRNTLASAVWGVIILGLLQLAVLVLLFYCNSLGLIVWHSAIHHGYNLEIFLALLIMSVCWISTASYIGIVHRILNPLGMLYQSTWMMMWLQVLQFFALITAAVFKFTILHTAILFSIVQIVFYVLSAIYVRSLLPQYYPWWTGNRPKTGIMNILRALPLTLGWMMSQGGMSALVVLISSLLGPVPVLVFSTLMTLSNLWATLINSFTQPLIPDIVRYYAKHEWYKLIVTNKVHGALIGAVVNLSVLLAYPFLGMIYKIWTWHYLLFDKPFLSLLLSAVVVSGMRTLVRAFFAAINDHAYAIISSAISGVLVLLVSWILIPLYGMLGVGIAIFMAALLLLTVTDIWSFYKVAVKINYKINWSLFVWPWLSAICVIAYLINQCFAKELLNIMYWVALGGVILSAVMSWNRLEHSVKRRIKIRIWQYGGRK